MFRVSSSAAPPSATWLPRITLQLHKSMCRFSSSSIEYRWRKRDGRLDLYSHMHNTIQYKYAEKMTADVSSNHRQFQGGHPKKSHFFLRLQDVPITHIVEQTGS